MHPTKWLADAANGHGIFGIAPVNWQIDRIRDRLTSIVGGEWGDDPEAHEEGTLIPVIRVADIRGIDLTAEGLTIRRIKESKVASRLIGSRSVLLEKSGGGEQKPVGRAVRCRAITFDAICSNFMAKIECGPSIDPAFLVYVFDALYTSGVNGSCIQQTTGIQNLRLLDYLNTKVGIPPLSDQLRIVEFLDCTCLMLGGTAATTQSSGTGHNVVGILNQQLEVLLCYQRSLIHECVSGRRRVTDEDIARVNGYALQLA